MARVTATSYFFRPGALKVAIYLPALRPGAEKKPLWFDVVSMATLVRLIHDANRRRGHGGTGGVLHSTLNSSGAALAE